MLGMSSAIAQVAHRAYSAHMATEIRDQRVPILLTPSELKEIDDWSFDRRIRSRGEAIRQLIALGLEAAARQKEKA